MRKPLLIFCFLLLSNIKIFAEFDVNPNCIYAYEKIFNLEFIAAQKIISLEESKNPKNKFTVYLRDYIDFLSLVIGENFQEYKTLKEKQSERIEIIEESSNNNPYKNYYLANVYLHWGISKLKFKDYFSGAYDINKAYRILQKNEKDFPAFTQNHISLGFLHAIIGSIPNEYQWLISILGFKGSIKEGMGEVFSVFNQTMKEKKLSYIKNESLFILTFLEINLQNKKSEAIQLLNYYKSIEKAIDSPILTYAYSNLAMKNGENNRAINLLSNRKMEKNNFPFYYLDYLTGVAKLNHLDKDAYIPLFNFISKFNGRNYIKSAFQKIGWFYLINGNQQKYFEKMEMVKKYGFADTDEDKQALNEAKSKEIPDTLLLKSRLLFDGGYYIKSLSLLINIKPNEYFKSIKNQLEYSYRLGRIYHEMDDFEKAIKYYESTIKNGSELSYYFAANSALQLGLIYEKKENFVLAKSYFNKSMNIKNTEYKNSISQKAKAGINRIDNK
ncbi:MAG: tetratricopeptide repeat protein [Bacteroidetes bacterium]|nr:tetratricopeptide repeat protein [Bacteroidota bacterium]